MIAKLEYEGYIFIFLLCSSMDPVVNIRRCDSMFLSIYELYKINLGGFSSI